MLVRKDNRRGIIAVFELYFQNPAGFQRGEFDMRRLFSFLIGILVGALAGSVTVLLTTPESGEQLRAQIRERGQGFANQIRNAADSRRIELRGRLEAMRAPRAS
jgi:uncharacterized membrane protein YccC